MPVDHRISAFICNEQPIADENIAGSCTGLDTLDEGLDAKVRKFTGAECSVYEEWKREIVG